MFAPLQDLLSQRWYRLLTPWPYLAFVVNTTYIILQHVIAALFAPPPPRKNGAFPFGKIAVVGAGITGISSAAHAMAHNFDVMLFEERSEEGLGGIWAHVNATSGLQLNSLLYRFFPSIVWSKGFPLREEIVGQARKIWTQYGLRTKTKFNARVVHITRKDEAPRGDPSAPSPHGNWMVHAISDDDIDIYGSFDAIIVAIGTCGKPKWIHLDGMPEEHQQPANKGKEMLDQTDRSQQGEGTSYAGKAKTWTDHEGTSSDSHIKVGETFVGAAKNSVTAANDKSRQENDNHNRSDHTGEKDTIKWPGLDGKDEDHDEGKYMRPIIHSSELDKQEVRGGDVTGKTVVIIGAGASAVEAAEAGLAKGAKKAIVIARSDKWVIPRNLVISTLIAAQPFGREMPLSFLWENFLRYFHYRSIKDISPADLGLFEGTPIVNDKFLKHIKKGSCRYVRGDPLRLTAKGVKVNVRSRGTKPGDPGTPEVIEGDAVIFATGFHKPELNFLSGARLFPETYDRPNLYLQNFSTEDWSVLMTNSAYQNAIGTVGHFHIGIYTRILLVFHLDPSTRPTSKDMKLWVDVIRYIKGGATGGAFSFFTYMELMIWLLAFHIFRPDRLKWLIFILFGWGVYAPAPDTVKELRRRTNKSMKDRKIHSINVKIDKSVTAGL